MIDKQRVNREILLSFWKVHVLHHAEEGGVVGSWMLQELRHHGYEVSPGTLYPLLKRLERAGWLHSITDGAGPRARRTYFITESGREALAIARKQLRELGTEVASKRGS
ncbi:MAG TPA: PadR family transcriptional regulator [Fimbriimonadaceae bacterium]|nr:PadR family transcriptional regulator [Fimbriimonadaceae bacterium]